MNELRQAQAVILPLELGLSMDQAAASIGVSKSDSILMVLDGAGWHRGDAYDPRKY